MENKNIEIEDLIIDEIIDRCEEKLDTEPKGSKIYAEYYNTRKLLLELKDRQDEEQFKVGDIVWVVEGDEANGDELECNDYVFMANCGDYIITTIEYINFKGEFRKQLTEMAIESYNDYGIELHIFHKRKVFKTMIEARKFIGEHNE